MTIITGKRGTGKTVELIKESNKLRLPILVNSVEQVKKIEELAKSLDLTIPTPVRLKDRHLLRKNEPSKRGVLVDNVEVILTSLLKTDVVTMTTNHDVHSLNKVEEIVQNNVPEDTFEDENLMKKVQNFFKRNK